MAASAMSNVPHINRLRQRAGFLRVKAQGQRAAFSGFTLQYWHLPAAEAPSASMLTIGFTCSKAAITKRAVDRNRARRRLQEAVRLALATRPSTQVPPMWLVFVARLAILKMPFRELQQQVAKALAQAGVPCASAS